jgi:hypothetical protein
METEPKSDGEVMDELIAITETDGELATDGECLLQAYTLLQQWLRTQASGHGDATPQRERGEAKIVAHLSDGRIKVVHGYDEVTLFDEPVHEGTWDAMWLAITSGAIQESGQVTA